MHESGDFVRRVQIFLLYCLLETVLGRVESDSAKYAIERARGRSDMNSFRLQSMEFSLHMFIIACKHIGAAPYKRKGDRSFLLDDQFLMLRLKGCRRSGRRTSSFERVGVGACAAWHSTAGLSWLDGVAHLERFERVRVKAILPNRQL